MFMKPKVLSQVAPVAQDVSKGEVDRKWPGCDEVKQVQLT